MFCEPTPAATQKVIPEMNFTSRFKNSGKRARIGTALGLTLVASAAIATLSVGPASAFDSGPDLGETTNQVIDAGESIELTDDGAVSQSETSPSDEGPIDETIDGTIGMTEVEAQAARENGGVVTYCMTGEEVEFADPVVLAADQEITIDAADQPAAADADGDELNKAANECAAEDANLHPLPSSPLR